MGSLNLHGKGGQGAWLRQELVELLSGREQRSAVVRMGNEV